MYQRYSIESDSRSRPRRTVRYRSTYRTSSSGRDCIDSYPSSQEIIRHGIRRVSGRRRDETYPDWGQRETETQTIRVKDIYLSPVCLCMVWFTVFLALPFTIPLIGIFLSILMWRDLEKKYIDRLDVARSWVRSSGVIFVALVSYEVSSWGLPDALTTGVIVGSLMTVVFVLFIGDLWWRTRDRGEFDLEESINQL